VGWKVNERNEIDEGGEQGKELQLGGQSPLSLFSFCWSLCFVYQQCNCFVEI
jgi:hypothetical protein